MLDDGTLDSEEARREIGLRVDHLGLHRISRLWPDLRGRFTARAPCLPSSRRVLRENAQKIFCFADVIVSFFIAADTPAPVISENSNQAMQLRFETFVTST